MALCFSLAMTPACLMADVMSTTGSLKFDVEADGQSEMSLTSTSLHIGTGTPSSNLHLDGNTIVENTLSIGTTQSSSNLNIGGTFSKSFTTLSTNGSISGHSVVLLDSSSGNISVSLTDASSQPGLHLSLKKTSSLNEVEITSSVTIDGNLSGFVFPAGDNLPYLQLIADASGWSVMTSSSYAVPVTSVANLIAHWRMDESSGTTVSDSSGLGFDVSLTGSLTFNGASGKVGNSLDFDGASGDRVSIGDWDAIEMSDVSFLFWAKLDSTATDEDFFIKDKHGTGEPLLIWFDEEVSGAAEAGGGNDKTLSVLSYDDDGDELWVAAPNNALNNTDWNHIGVVMDVSSGTITIYINGSNVQSHSDADWDGIRSDTQPLTLGDPTVSGGHKPLNGFLDEVRVYSRALSDAEVQAIYDSEN